MNLSTRRSRNSSVQLTLTLAFFLFQAGLMAQDYAEMVLFEISDEDGSRVEITVLDDGGVQELFVRFYEDGDVLLLERPFREVINVDGLSVSPFRLRVLGPKPGNDANGGKSVVLKYEVITHNTGSGTSPTGPPPPETPNPPD